MIDTLENEDESDCVDDLDEFRLNDRESTHSMSSNFISKLKHFIPEQTLNDILYVLLRIPLIILYDYLLTDIFAKRVETYLDNPIRIPDDKKQFYSYMILAFLQDTPLKILVKLNTYLSIPVIGLIILTCLILCNNRSLTMIYSYTVSLLMICSSYYIHRRIGINYYLSGIELLILASYLQMLQIRPRVFSFWIQRSFCYWTAVIFISNRLLFSLNIKSTWIDIYYCSWLLVHLSEILIFRPQQILRIIMVNCLQEFFSLYRIGGLQEVLSYLQEHIPVTRLLKIFWCTKVVISPLGIRYLYKTPVFNEVIYQFKMVSNESIEQIENVNYLNQSWTSSFYLTTIFHATETVLCLISLACIIASIMDIISSRIFRSLDLWSDTAEQVGTLTGVIFFLLIFQSNLIILDLNIRHIPLLKAFGLLPVATCSFLHTVLEPALLKTAMQNMLANVLTTELDETTEQNKIRQSKIQKFVKILKSFHEPRVYQCLGMIAILLFYLICLWRTTKFSTWLITVTGFILELNVRLLGSLVQYCLHVFDGHNLLKDADTFEDYIFLTKTVTSCCEFVLGIGLLCNGFYVLVFEAPNIVRAVILIAHTNLNIIKKFRRGWQLLNNRRSASEKVNHLLNPSNEQIEQYNSVCSICLTGLTINNACITPCAHLFHRKCLQKAFHANQNCPLCSQVIS